MESTPRTTEKMDTHPYVRQLCGSDPTMPPTEGHVCPAAACAENGCKACCLCVHKHKGQCPECEEDIAICKPEDRAEPEIDRVGDNWEELEDEELDEAKVQVESFTTAREGKSDTSDTGSVHLLQQPDYLTSSERLEIYDNDLANSATIKAIPATPTLPPVVAGPSAPATPAYATPSTLPERGILDFGDTHHTLHRSVRLRQVSSESESDSVQSEEGAQTAGGDASDSGNIGTNNYRDDFDDIRPAAADSVGSPHGVYSRQSGFNSYSEYAAWISANLEANTMPKASHDERTSVVASISEEDYESLGDCGGGEDKEKEDTEDSEAGSQMDPLVDGGLPATPGMLAEDFEHVDTRRIPVHEARTALEEHADKHKPARKPLHRAVWKFKFGDRIKIKSVGTTSPDVDEQGGVRKGGLAGLWGKVRARRRVVERPLFSVL